LIAHFLGNVSAKYYENPTMLSRVQLKMSGMFFEAQHSSICRGFMHAYTGTLQLQGVCKHKHKTRKNTKL